MVEDHSSIPTHDPEDEFLYCPFCGVNMDGYDAYAHSLTHGPEHILDIHANAGAIRRRKQLTENGGVTLENLEV